MMDLTNKTILIAEDDEISFKFLDLVLSRKTHVSIIWAINGQMAVDFCRMYNHIDLVLMDIQLPDMSGLQASSSIKGINSKIPIIIQTAYSFESYMKKSQEIGCDCYLLKPIDPQKLYEAIKKILQKKTR
jgi:two-component system, cell cycle response regulator DivK